MACASDGFVLVMANVGVMSMVIIVHSELLSTHLEGITAFCRLRGMLDLNWCSPYWLAEAQVVAFQNLVDVCLTLISISPLNMIQGTSPKLLSHTHSQNIDQQCQLGSIVCRRLRQINLYIILFCSRYKIYTYFV